MSEITVIPDIVVNKIENLKSENNKYSIEVNNDNDNNNNNNDNNNKNDNYIKIDDNDSDDWNNSLSRRKRSSLFQDTAAIEDEAQCSVAFEYLCRLEEVRRYLSSMLSLNLSEFPKDMKFEHQLCNCVWICQLMQLVLPTQKIAYRILDKEQAKYKKDGLIVEHYRNIELFIACLYLTNFPDVLMVTVEEVFKERKRLKLVYCVQALAYYLSKIQLTKTKLENLEKVLKFDDTVLLDVMKMLDEKEIDLPSFNCMQALVDDEMIYQQLKLEQSPLPRGTSMSGISEKSYMTMRPTPGEEESDNTTKAFQSSSYSDARSYNDIADSEKSPNRRHSVQIGHNGEPIYEDADKFIFNNTSDSLLNSIEVPQEYNNNNRRRSHSLTKLANLSVNKGSFVKFPSKLDYNYLSCRSTGVQICMFTKPNVEMSVSPAAKKKSSILHSVISPQTYLTKLKYAVSADDLTLMMELLSTSEFGLPETSHVLAKLYLEELKKALEISLNKYALAIYYGLQKNHCERYLSNSCPGSYLLRAGIKSPYSLSLSIRNKRGIKHFKILLEKSNKLVLKNKSITRHSYTYIEELIREMIDILQNLTELTLTTCVAHELSINPCSGLSSKLTSLSLDQVVQCINSANNRALQTEPSMTWVPPTENPYTGLWNCNMLVPVERLTAEILLLQYGRVGSFLVRPKSNSEFMDYVTSIRTEDDVTHIKILRQETGFTISGSAEIFPSLERLIENFTFNDNLLGNITLKPVRIPPEKFNELNIKNEIEYKKSCESDLQFPKHLKLKHQLSSSDVPVRRGTSYEDLVLNETIVKSSNGSKNTTQSPHLMHKSLSNLSSIDNKISYDEYITENSNKAQPICPLAECRSLPPFSYLINNNNNNNNNNVGEVVPHLEETANMVMKLSYSIDDDDNEESFSPQLLSPTKSRIPDLSYTRTQTSPQRKRPSVKRKSAIVNTPLPPIPINHDLESPQLPPRPLAMMSTQSINLDRDNESDMQTNNIGGTRMGYSFTSKSRVKLTHQASVVDENLLSKRPVKTNENNYRMLPSSVSSMDINSYQQSAHRAYLGDIPNTVTTKIPGPTGYTLTSQTRTPQRRYTSYSQDKRRPEKEHTKVFLTQPDASPLSKLSDSSIISDDTNFSTELMSPIKNEIVIEHQFENWNIQQVEDWLKENGLEQYHEVFKHNDIDGSALTDLTNENLRDDIGIRSFGHRSKILKLIKAMKN